MSDAMKLFMKDEIEAERQDAVMQEKIKTAKNMQAMGMVIPMIAKALEVPEEIVRKWLESKVA